MYSDGLVRSARALRIGSSVKDPMCPNAPCMSLAVYEGKAAAPLEVMWWMRLSFGASPYAIRCRGHCFRQAGLASRIDVTRILSAPPQAASRRAGGAAGCPMRRARGGSPQYPALGRQPPALRRSSRNHLVAPPLAAAFPSLRRIRTSPQLRRKVRLELRQPPSLILCRASRRRVKL